MPEISEDEERRQLVEALRRLEKSRPDKIGLAGDLVSTALGMAGGAAASGSIAAAAGATTIFGSSTLGGVLGGVFVASTPVGWVIGASLAGGALAYGATRLVRSGEAADQTRKSMLQRLKAKLRRGVQPHQAVAEGVRVAQYEVKDKDAYYKFIERLRETVERGSIEPGRAERLITAVTTGSMAIDKAMNLLEPFDSEDESEPSAFRQWLTLDAYRDLLKSAINSEADPDLDQLNEYLRENVPRIWLLGKTGAGKSSLVAEITEQSDVEIGNGFEPCTTGINRYQFPREQPLMEFLDTRGLSEAGYIAEEDIEQASSQAHAIVVVVKTDDPEQSAVIETLSGLKAASRERVLVVYTASHGAADEQEVKRAIKSLQNHFKKALRFEFPYVFVDFPAQRNVDQLREKLAALMPSAEHFLHKSGARDHEEQVYLNQRARILWHAGAAGSADFVPGMGLVAVPTIQIKMLYQLSEAYDLNWQRKEVLEFLGSLGTSFSIGYGSRVLITQLGRFIPVWGQTVGQATAVAVSFGLTYALGRGACFYMYHKRHGREVDPEQLKAVYEQALKRENLGLKSEDAA